MSLGVMASSWLRSGLRWTALCAGMLALGGMTALRAVQAQAEDSTPGAAVTREPISDKPDQGPRAVIGPGQEELLADMLGRGAVLAGNCKLDSGQVEFGTIKATYACPDGNVVFVLAQPSQAADARAQTSRFAISLESGTPPSGLLADLEARIRAKESAFTWTWVGTTEHISRNAVVVAAGGVVALALLAWAIRSRRRAHRGPAQ